MTKPDEVGFEKFGIFQDNAIFETVKLATDKTGLFGCVAGRVLDVVNAIGILVVELLRSRVIWDLDGEDIVTDGVDGVIWVREGICGMLFVIVSGNLMDAGSLRGMAMVVRAGCVLSTGNVRWARGCRPMFGRASRAVWL